MATGTPSSVPISDLRVNRRKVLTIPAIAVLGSGISSLACGAVNQPSSTEDIRNTLRYCLNTSTINGGVVPVRQQLKIASEAGYQAVELWLRDIEKFAKEGGKLSDLRKELEDLGLGLDSAIAFGKWIVDDEAERKAGLEQCRRDMEVVKSLGGGRIAAPPVGATNLPKLDLTQAASRYRALLEVGREVGVLPQLELWGFSQNISTLAEVLFVAAGANHPDACLLLDVYHMYKGGNDFGNIGLVPATKMHCLHMNDYPATPNRQEIGDKDRVYTGDGVAPMYEILRGLFASGFRGTFSLELFNRTYWEQPADQVARMGIEKMKQVVEAALA
jgi:2-keto-myo-inositol isomerase